MKTIVVISLTILVAGCGSQLGEEDVGFLEVPISELADVSVNHEQGGIGWRIEGTNYFYYVSSENDVNRVLATSALLDDILNASTVQLKHVEYGLHRRVVNMLLFYGERTIPNGLQTEASNQPVEATADPPSS